MTLGEKQRLFLQLLGQFLVWIYEAGYAVSGGELERSQAQADANAASGAGISNSLHLKRLAIDLNLFLLNDGKWEYQGLTEAYRPLGEKWKSLHELCRWGGDFQTRPDGNHFSLEHEGVR
jgi:hypothetical protein